MKTHIQLYIQNCGTAGHALLIEGNASDIKTRFNSFWNHGATNGKLHWQTETAAYFWTDEKKLLKAMENICLFKLLNAIDSGDDSFKGVKGGAMPTAKKLANIK